MVRSGALVATGLPPPAPVSSPLMLGGRGRWAQPVAPVGWRPVEEKGPALGRSQLWSPDSGKGSFTTQKTASCCQWEQTHVCVLPP